MHVTPGHRRALRLGAVAVTPLAAAVFGLTNPVHAEPAPTPSGEPVGGAAAAAAKRDITFTASPRTTEVQVGKVAELTFTITNRGTADAKEPYYGFLTTPGVQVVAKPAECLEFNLDEPAAEAAAAQEFAEPEVYFDCELDSLKAGATATRKVTVKLTENAENFVFAFADDWAYESLDQEDDNPDDNYAEVAVRPAKAVPSPTPSASTSPKPSASASPSAGASPSRTASPTASASASPGLSASASASASSSPGAGPSLTAGPAPSASKSATASASPSKSAAVSPSATGTTTPTSAPPVADGDGGSGGDLPRTGFSAVSVAGAGAAVALGGAILLVLARRRRA
ncbi:LPXTG cell wall anchor domain-containing protein [Catellatospora sp. KI3]|uniref:LPXTG cell wall anchor domain-containing protein n=1 Tax=Catellatospora sp. KI3 TaxID=3041620 RepID=UPI0024829E52|nr:LPXTG cell wall anchor domain-containing protein [Catellatospora sp. KI3]MDI1461892.1 LPXTG cell wall anchor domain-containing protein [Catellatospora sp. KI3]